MSALLEALDLADGDLSLAFETFWDKREQLEAEFLTALKAIGQRLEGMGVKVDMSEDNLVVIRSCMDDYPADRRSDEIDVHLAVLQGTIYEAMEEEKAAVA